MKIGLIHSNYPFKMEPRIEVKIRKGLPEGKYMGTPNVSYEKLGINKKYDLKKRHGRIVDAEKKIHLLLDKNYLWKEFLDEYRQNIENASKKNELFEIKANKEGYIKDFSWLEEEVYMGGCFLDGCLHNAIRGAQIELLNRGKDPAVNIIPEISLCSSQPAQVTFMEKVNEMNTIMFGYPNKPMTVLNNKIKVVNLEDI